MTTEILTPPIRGRANKPDPRNTGAISRNAMISTSHPLATAAGVAALRKGGSAVDAYLAAAAVQTVVEPTMTSLGGGLGITVFDPSTGESRIAGGVGQLPAAEDGKLDADTRWTGRTVVPPGWVHGAHTAWTTWGKLDWADVFDHAARWAREGFIVDEQMWGGMFENRTVLGRYPAGRDVWCPDGRMVSVGDTLRQPALALTMEQIGRHGPDYVYRGDFARNYVEAARAAGGRITLEDMEAAQATSPAPTLVPRLPLADGREVHTGGFMYALLLNLAIVGGLASMAPPTEDAHTLYLQMRIIEEAWHHLLGYVGSNVWEFKGIGELADAVSVETAQRLWSQVESQPSRPFDSMNTNTNAIVVVDESGLVAHGTHSHSGTPFGVGLMVDGVMVPRPMYYFSDPLVAMPAGWSTSLLVVERGKPIFAAGSPSISAVQCVFQTTMNVLSWGMEPGESACKPRFGASHYPSQRPMIETSFGQPLIDELEQRGVGLSPVTPWEIEMGSCHAIHIDQDGTLRGAADPRRLGQVTGI